MELWLVEGRLPAGDDFFSSFKCRLLVMKFSVSLLVLAGVCSSTAALLPAFALDLDLDKMVTREQVKKALLERISLFATPLSANQGSSDQASSDQGLSLIHI